jgi:tetratricopeptide (TPR) repeat protein
VSNFESRTHFIVFLLLALLVALAYANSLPNDFAGDDLLIIVKNREIRSIEGLAHLLKSDYWANYRGAYEPIASQSSGLYRPLTMATYALNYAVGGLAPWGFHFGNLVFHLLATWFLYLVALRIGMRPEAAVVAASIFAVHPLHTEAVTGVVGRAELLMGAGVLGAIWAHLTRRPAVALTCFAISLLSKEQAVVLPVLLLLYDLSRRAQRPESRHAGDYVPDARYYAGYVAVLAGYLALRAVVLGGLPFPPVNSVENPLISLKGEPWLLMAVKVAGMYVALFFWPNPLVADYSSHAILAVSSPVEPAVLWGFMTWGGLLALAAWSFLRVPRVFFSSAFCVLAFLPVSNLMIPIGTIMAERLFYLPSAGLCLLLGIGYEAVRRSVDRHSREACHGHPQSGGGDPSDADASTSPTPPYKGGEARLTPHASRFKWGVASRLSAHALRIIVAVVCLALAARTIVRNQDWKDAERLYRSTVEQVPLNAKAYVFLGGALSAGGRYHAALDAYDTASLLESDYPKRDARFNLDRGAVLYKLGRLKQAIESFEQAVTLDPGWGKARNYLAQAYGSLPDLDKAETVLRYAVKMTPQSPDLYGTLSLILNERGKYQDALAFADASLQREAAHPWGLLGRAIALEGLHRSDEARAMYERIMSLPLSKEYLGTVEEAKARLKQRERKDRAEMARCIAGLVKCK